MATRFNSASPASVHGLSMTDPVQHAVVPLATPALAVTAASFNIELWPFGITFLFAFVALAYADTADLEWLKAIKNVVGSTLIGGMFAQILAKPACLILGSLITSIKPWTDTAEIPMMAALAITFGLVLHLLVPVVQRWLVRKVENN